MTKIARLARDAAKVLSDNSPSILTAVGVTGLLGTVVAAVRATPEAVTILEYDREQRQEEDAEPQVPLDVVKLTWRLYIPAAVIGGATIACIIGANSISSRRNAALVSVYALTEKAFGEYKEQVVRQIGEGKEQKVRDVVNQNRLDHSSSDKEVIIYGAGNVLCFDTLTGRRFESSVETIKKAEILVNRECINNMYASQNDFYRHIGLPPVQIGDELGWNNDNPLEVIISALIEDDKPVVSIDYRKQPILKYDKIW